MKNFWLILAMGFFILQSCQKPEDNYQDAIFLFEEDLIHFIELNEAYLDSLKLKSSNSQQLTKVVRNITTINNATFSEICITSDCFERKARINNDCIPKGGPCSVLGSGIVRLILFFRKVDIYKGLNFQLIDLETGKEISSASSPFKITDKGFGFTLPITPGSSGRYVLVPNINGIQFNGLPINASVGP